MHPGELVDDLLALGVRAGGVLLVHASLRALGHVADGAEAVIQALLAALGDGGTLLMPALTYERVTPENPVFDVNHTPANVGILPETFRRRAGTRRSVHPTHSVCAVGPLTAALLDPHLEDSTPCGPHSPFHALPGHHGQILMLGCGLQPNTSMHAIEEQVVPPYLYGSPVAYRLTLADGTVIRKTYTPHNFGGWSQRYERVAHLLAAPVLRRGRVLAAEAHLIEAAALWEAAVPALRRDPLCFVERQA